ncbi:MAG: IclR family transcriptional regulator [Candidatus Binataceae bacterium]
MRSHDDTRAYFSQVLDRVIRILDCFTADDAELGLQDFVDRAGLHKSTVYRLLAAMRGYGLVGFDASTLRYHAGFRLFELGSLAISRLKVDKFAHPTLEKLVEQTGETSHLCVLDGADVIYVAKVESRRALRIPSAVGSRNPAYCTGVGKAMLAHLGNDALAAYFERTLLRPFTRRTMTSRKQLVPQLRQIASQGYAIDDQEREDGVRCIAAPVRGHDGRVVAAVSCAGPATRITKDRIAELARYVIDAASEISAKLGYGRAANGASAARFRTDGTVPKSARTVAAAAARRAKEERNGI